MRSDDETVRQRFGALVADAARRAGYDIDSPRGGGKAALARDTGMPESSVGRMLAGKTLPDPRYFEPIARAVRLDLRDLLIEAEIISRDALRPGGEPGVTQVRSHPITPAQAAQELGILDPVDREMFFGMVERLRRHRQAQAETEDGDSRGGEAAHM